MRADRMQRAADGQRRANRGYTLGDKFFYDGFDFHTRQHHFLAGDFAEFQQVARQRLHLARSPYDFLDNFLRITREVPGEIFEQHFAIAGGPPRWRAQVVGNRIGKRLQFRNGFLQPGRPFQDLLFQRLGVVVQLLLGAVKQQVRSFAVQRRRQVLRDRFNQKGFFGLNVEAELKSKAKAGAFEKFCERLELPDLEAKTIDDVKLQLSAAFGEGDLTIKPNRSEKSLAVEVLLPDGTQLNTSIPVRPLAPEDTGEPEVPLKFVPFPVSLPGDPELVWLLAKRENLSPDEAGIALTKAQDDFWASKTGQKLLRDRVERCFPEFISRAPAGMLSDAGLKRHYKTPEPVKVLRPEVLHTAKRAGSNG